MSVKKPQIIRTFNEPLNGVTLDAQFSNKTPISRSQGRVFLNCEVCGISFSRKASEAKRSEHHYCSKSCVGISQRKRVEVSCRECNKKYFIKKSHVGKITCCSKECKSKVLSKIRTANDLRMWADGTFTGGEGHNVAKLTQNQVDKIITDERKHRIIAEQYGVTRACISMIKRGETWTSTVKNSDS